MKGQLSFFAFQLASLVLFLIVLFSILFMKRSLFFTLKEFETQTLYHVGSRTLLSTPSCLAHEEVYRYKDPASGEYKTFRRVYPGVIDFDKYVSTLNFNCMRKDFSVEKGGASFRYCMLVIDGNRTWANYTRSWTEYGEKKVEAPFYKCSLIYDGEAFTPKAVVLQEKAQICPKPYRVYGFSMGYVNGTFRPIFIVLEECVLSNKYEGRSFCEVNVQVKKR